MAPAHSEEAAALAAAAHLPPIVAELLLARGIKDAREAHAFFNPDPAQLHDPFLMLGMRAAVDRIQRAIDQKETILLYGDYDVDGTTAVVLLKTAIEMLGGHGPFPRAASPPRRLRTPVKRARGGIRRWRAPRHHRRHRHARLCRSGNRAPPRPRSHRHRPPLDQRRRSPPRRPGHPQSQSIRLRLSGKIPLRRSHRAQTGASAA